MNTVPLWHRGLLTVAQAAEIAGVGTSTLRAQIEAGNLAVNPHFSTTRISRLELDRWMDAAHLATQSSDS